LKLVEKKKKTMINATENILILTNPNGKPTSKWKTPEENQFQN